MFSYLVKNGALFTVVAFLFSLIGIFMPSSDIGTEGEDILSSLTFEEVAGHAFWGVVAGVVSVSFRYILVTGLFVIAIDSDHIINIILPNLIGRMAHSMPFAIIITIIMILAFRKKDYLLGACGFAAVLSHISFDIFASGGGDFPLLVPFSETVFSFNNYDWVYFQVLAIVIILIVVILQKRNIIKSGLYP